VTTPGTPAAGLEPQAPGISEPASRIARLSPAELHFLRQERLLGRLATSDREGQPHVVPVGWSYDEALGTFDISGRDFAATRKYRNVLANPRAALVIDDVLPPWQPRAVHVQGPAQAVPADPATSAPALIRITPTKVTSWGLADPSS
jgi:pyridoxamine 5'-phosphate oxidase family protein